MKPEEPILQKYAQIISEDLMRALRESAQERRVNLEVEIALRLMVSLTQQKLSKDWCLLDEIKHKKFSAKEAAAECRRKREGNHYLFEIEKLRNFLRFEHSLPRHVKEIFTLIDVKEESKRIKAENKKNRE